MLYASVIWLLVHHMMTEGNPERNMQCLWQFILEFYVTEHVPHRYGQLKLSMITSRMRKCVLKGKAAEVKWLGPAVLAAWLKYMNPHLGSHRNIRLLLDLSTKMDCILEDHPYPTYFKLPESAAREFIETTHAFCALMVQVQAEFQEPFPGSSLFNVTVKLHFLLEIAYRAGHLNPRATWCFRGEAFMGILRPLAQSCSRGRAPTRVLQATIAKWLKAFFLKATRTL